jgi:hypothetical protein
MVLLLLLLVVLLLRASLLLLLRHCRRFVFTRSSFTRTISAGCSTR